MRTSHTTPKARWNLRKVGVRLMGNNQNFTGTPYGNSEELRRKAGMKVKTEMAASTGFAGSEKVGCRL